MHRTRKLTLRLTTAAVFALAGTAAGQKAPAGKQSTPAQPPAQSSPAAPAGAAAGNPNATGKLITKAGDGKQAKEEPALRDPLAAATQDTGGDKVKVDE